MGIGVSPGELQLKGNILIPVYSLIALKFIFYMIYLQMSVREMGREWDSLQEQDLLLQNYLHRYRPLLGKGLDQLIVKLYTLSIYPSTQTADPNPFRGTHIVCKSSQISCRNPVGFVVENHLNKYNDISNNLIN